VKFEAVLFWVKAYDVPAKRQTATFVEILGKKIGRFVGCDPLATCDIDKSLSFQVDVDVTKSLMRGIRIVIAQKPIWITLRCVKLPDFCYGCGMLGHIYKSVATLIHILMRTPYNMENGLGHPP